MPAAGAGRRPGRTVLGLDTDRTATAGVDASLAVSLDAPGRLEERTLALVAAEFGSVACVVELFDDEDVTIRGTGAGAGARLAVSEALTGAGGRAVLFPGWASLTGARTGGELVARSALHAVVDLFGVAVDPAATVATRDFVRPLRSGGRLVLSVQAARGCLVPFEVPVPTPCCAVHAGTA